MKSAGRKLISSLGIFVLGSCLITTASAANLSQQQLSDFAGGAQLRFGVTSNFLPSGSGFTGRITLNNQSSVALPAGKSDWRIYIHSVRKIEATEVAGVRIAHVQGDLHELAPTAGFAGLAAGANLELPFASGPWVVSYSDFMPRAFIAQPGLKPEVFENTDTEKLSDFVDPFTKPEQQLRFAKPTADLFAVATAATRYQDNLAVNAAAKPDNQARIVPTPVEVKYRNALTTLDGTWRIRFAGRLTGEAAYLKAQLKTLGLTVESAAENVAASGKIIDLRVDERVGKPESYQLNIEASKITITGSDNAGAFYGIQSLLSVIPVQAANSYSIPQLSAADGPRYTWRGMHYDMGRNFHGKEVTLRLIEQMARYKLNKLHLHLTEDEGWRLEIPGLPELTDIGAHRCFDLSEETCLLTQLGTGPHKTGSGNGYYTVNDFVEILKFAAARHIEVIPEIDMPGHARAAVKSMDARYKKLLKAGQKAEAEQYLLSDPLDKSKYMTVQNYTDNSVNVCLPSTYAFTEKVIYELQQMYRKAGLRLSIFHMGGDEVGAGSWVDSPACKALVAKGEANVAGPADFKPYFVGRLAEITSRRGLTLAGWEDGLMYDATNTFNRKQFANERVMANTWDNIWEWGVADRAYRLANAGYEVILSPGTHLYFDHPYEVNAEERGYYWAARYTDTGKVFGFMPDNLYANADKTRGGENIANLEALVGRAMPKLEKPENLKGIQGQVWSETIRTGEQMEQMIYPRLIPLAERAWHKAAWESDKPDVNARTAEWAQFASTLSAKELPRLAASGAAFYLPPPGAIVDGGKLRANTSLPGLAIEYSTDNGANWSSYTGEAMVDAKKIIVRSRLGNATSRTTAVE